MDFIEWLLAGIGIRSVQRPLVFVLMGIATVFFGGLSIAMLILIGAEIGESEKPMTLIALGGSMAFLFGGLAGISGYMVKRSFDSD